jgi:hypothetical protein
MASSEFEGHLRELFEGAQRATRSQSRPLDDLIPMKRAAGRPTSLNDITALIESSNKAETKGPLPLIFSPLGWGI